MTIKKEPRKTWYLWDTNVENLFICEYMPEAPGNYVKVYLYALMVAASKKPPSVVAIAKALRLSEEDVKKALMYFEEAGLIKREGGDLVFLSLKEKLYGNDVGGTGHVCSASYGDNATGLGEERPKSRHILDNEAIKELFSAVQMETGKFLTTTETDAILGWLQDYGASHDIIAKAYRYCVTKGKTNYKYVGTVVKDWTSRGFYTAEDVEACLKEEDKRHYTYGRIMKSLGFHRIVTEEERRIIDVWLDEMNCTMDQILNACGKTSGISNPNIRYVNAVLKNMAEEEHKGPSRKNVMARYEELREEGKRRAGEARAEIYRAIPEIRQLDQAVVEAGKEKTKIMISGGMDKAHRIAKINVKLEKIARQKEELFTEHDIPIDYANIRYTCDICKDTGTTEDGQLCRCYRDREAEVVASKQVEKS